MEISKDFVRKNNKSKHFNIKLYKYEYKYEYKYGYEFAYVISPASYILIKKISHVVHNAVQTLKLLLN